MTLTNQKQSVSVTFPSKEQHPEAIVLLFGCSNENFVEWKEFYSGCIVIAGKPSKNDILTRNDLITRWLIRSCIQEANEVLKNFPNLPLICRSFSKGGDLAACEFGETITSNKAQRRMKTVFDAWKRGGSMLFSKSFVADGSFPSAHQAAAAAAVVRTAFEDSGSSRSEIFAV